MFLFIFKNIAFKKDLSSRLFSWKFY